MFPHFITSKRFKTGMTVVMWQLDHYHYEIDITGTNGYVKLPDTSFEDAMNVYDQFCEVV